jgi:hypothetical protein
MHYLLPSYAFHVLFEISLLRCFGCLLFDDSSLNVKVSIFSHAVSVAVKAPQLSMRGPLELLFS